MNLKKLEFEKLIEQISTLYREKKYSQLKSILADINPTDIAVLFDEFPNEQRILLFRLLPKEEAAETFVELDGETQEALIHAFSDTELREVIDELYLDDTVDIIEEMPATIVKRILRNTDAQTRKSINTLLKYPEDSAGSIMTPEFVDLKKDNTVEDAFKRIRRTGVDKETIYTCYVTDSSRHLIGVTTVKELLLHDYGDKIEEFMETNTIFVNTHDDKEIAANFLDKYNFLALPVVDMENRLVGIITVDDAIDVLQEENTEDIQNQLFSLGGLNCGLCPMFLNKYCPGCGGGEGNQYRIGIKERYSTDLNENSNIMQEKEIRIHYNDIIEIILWR